MGLGLGQIAQAKTTSELVADALRSAILQGKLTSGQSLKQDELATEFKVSKIPVREALVQLEAEGLVSLKAGRGATVSELTLEDIQEIYAIRTALEPIALGQAIPRYTDTDLRLTEAILDEIDQSTDKAQWAELNWAFHESLYRPAQMPRLLQITKTLHNNVARYLLTHYLDHGYLGQSQAQHRQILSYCWDRNVDAACAALRQHLGDPVDVIRVSISRT